MMSSKERWLAALRLQPVDRLPFWPKLGAAYAAMQAAPFQQMSVDALHQWLGSDKLTGVEGTTRLSRATTSLEVTTKGSLQRKVYQTPFGGLVGTDRFDQTTQSWHPVEFPVKRREDLAVMAAWYADQRVEADPGCAERGRAACRTIGDSAVTCAGAGTSPLMEFVQHLAGVEGAHLLLADWPQEVEGLFAAMHQVMLRGIELESLDGVTDIIMLTENTSTTLISPAQYGRYCLPHIRAYARVARDAGRLLVLHMCGHIKALLPELASLPVAGFEAFTSPPVGNTTLLDGRTGCPDKCLIGGTNAMLWLRPAREIIAQIERDLDALPHHRGLVITSAGVMPPRCAPDTVKAVGEWVRSYPVRL